MPSLPRRMVRYRPKKQTRRKQRRLAAQQRPYRPVKSYFLSDKPLDYDEYLISPYWLTLRAKVLATRDHCEQCGTKYRLNLHHRYYYKDGQSVLYHERDYPDVFMVLCRRCHIKQHDTWTAET